MEGPLLGAKHSQNVFEKGYADSTMNFVLICTPKGEGL